MPKRACPFEDEYPPQMKVHVGQKQVDNGVCKEERMKEVYDKTLGMMRDGMRSLSRRFDSSTDLDAEAPPTRLPVSPCKSSQARCLKQTVLNSRLGLEVANGSVKDNQPKQDLCWCGRVIDKTGPSKCSYCDQTLCSSCLAECVSCTEPFCQSCSLPVYDQEERNVCLNCYRHR